MLYNRLHRTRLGYYNERISQAFYLKNSRLEKTMELTQEQIKHILEETHLEQFGLPLLDSGMTVNIDIKGKNVFVMIGIDTDKQNEAEKFRKHAQNAIEKIENTDKVMVVLTAEKTSQPQKTEASSYKPPEPIQGIRHIIAVASGKGGVGKSTIATNIALALQKKGLKIGLLDADVYGPSVPRLTGITGHKAEIIHEDHEEETTDKNSDKRLKKKIRPPEVYNIKVMSMGFLVPEDKAVIWRGPMVSSAVRQLLYDVKWGELDILVVDMPPGTGDAQLTLAQRVPLSGAIIVSTPQNIALADAKKGVEMFRKVDIPILGMIENMSIFICPNCGHESHIFGYEGTKREAEKLQCELLGNIPLNPEIRETSDMGTPLTVGNNDNDISIIFDDIADKVLQKLGNRDE